MLQALDKSIPMLEKAVTFRCNFPDALSLTGIEGQK
jgi:hypothetical protein